jgi:hypothetical protein
MNCRDNSRRRKKYPEEIKEKYNEEEIWRMRSALRNGLVLAMLGVGCATPARGSGPATRHCACQPDAPAGEGSSRI